MLYPVIIFPVYTAVLVKTKAVVCAEHRETLLAGLTRFTNYTQIQLVNEYISKLEDTNSWYKQEVTNPSDKANTWFCELLSNSAQRIDTADLGLKKEAVKALAKVHNNAHHNFIVNDIVTNKRKGSLQLSFVKQTAKNLEYAQLRKVVTFHDEKPTFIHKTSSAAVSLVDSIEDRDEIQFVYDSLANVPKPLQLRVAKRFINKYDPALEKMAQLDGESSEDYKARLIKILNTSTKQPLNSATLKNHYKANQWLRRVVKTLKPRLKILNKITDAMPLPWHILANADKTKKHGSVLAREVLQIISDLGLEKNSYTAVDAYEVIANYANKFGVSLDMAEKGEYLTEPDAEVALLKAQCHKWWARKLKTIRKRYLEHLEIATGEVGKDLFTRYDKKHGTRSQRRGINAYCSKNAVREYTNDQERGKRYLESLELVNEQNDVISLMKAVEAGVANPVNMRNELMLRIRETEELADEMGYVGMFLNITAPSHFHANSHKWDGSTPKEASAYLNKLYSQARAKLDRLEIPYFGIRVAEPHADGCPHWHMLIWTPERYYHRVNHVLRRYFTRDDRGVFFERFKNRRSLRANYVRKRRVWGLNKSKGKYTREPIKDYFPSGPRYTAIRMEPAKVDADGKRKGGAAAYVAKYVSKNIDGFALANEFDAETGEKLTQSVNPVKAWASTWGIRQFQFQKSPAITIWRELRRVREAIKGNEELEQVRTAVNKGDFKTFVVLMGGFGIGRDARFKPVYQFTEFGNQYAECVKRLKGVEDTQSLCTVVTRVHTWDKQAIGTAAANDNTAAESMQDANNVGAADLSWTSGNNCTLSATRHREELLLDMIGFEDKEIRAFKKDLLNGFEVRRNDQIYRIRGGQLQVLDEKAQVKHDKQLDIEYRAKSFAQKSGSWHVTNDHWQQAKELVELAYQYAELDGRTKLKSTRNEKGEFHFGATDKGLVEIGDWDLAILVKQGGVSAVSDNDWWALDMMA